MEYWQILIISGIVFIIVEMLTPVLFFFNLALACFVTAVFAYFIKDWSILIPIFVLFSAIFLFFLRPLLLNKRGNNGAKTGVEEKYIGKIAKVTSPISKNKGVVTIYNERWEARTLNDEEIPVGSDVKIIKNESIILYVEKI